MKILPLLLLVSTLAFAALAKSEEPNAANDADISERAQFTEKDLPKDEKDPAGTSEIDSYARGHGFNYAKLTRRAARGDEKALKTFFAIAQDVDGGAAESHAGVPFVVYHLLGDEKFAKFLNGQPLAYRMMVRNSIVYDGLSSAGLYFRRYFPRQPRFSSAARSWTGPRRTSATPSGKSSPMNSISADQKSRAELIEQETGQVLCDLTNDDIGVGADREGEVLWAPDAQRFAYRSSDLRQQQGNLFSTPRPTPHRKQTAVYQLSGESFTRVDLNLTDIPGRENDEELKAAILGHDYIEPIRWEKPNVLLLERHEYYEVLKPDAIGEVKFESIHTLARWHRITATITPDGKATVVWKVRKDR